MQRIESLSNAKLKRLKSLHRKKVRDDLNLFLVEGKKVIKEALLSSFSISEIFFTNSFLEEESDFLNDFFKLDQISYVIRDNLFEKLTNTKTPQGIIAIIEKKEFDVKSIIESGKSLLLLDKVSDPGNVGTIIRTAEAFSFGCCFYTAGSADLYNEKVIRSTMGSIFRIPYVKFSDEVYQLLIDNDYQFIGLDIHGNNSNLDKLTRKSVIIIGNEANGLSDEIKNICNHLLKINMAGETESLNAAIASAIIMYEISKII
ncbi:MAG: RNA methyltransferase [Clostridiales bacterium]|nr:RNA methyltransferase [Clostridiales bacterium]